MSKYIITIDNKVWKCELLPWDYMYIRDGMKALTRNGVIIDWSIEVCEE